jgi:hypothetical protein
MHELVGKKCRLVRPIRDPEGKSRYREELNPTIIRVGNNLDRLMLYVQLSDETIMVLFPKDIEIIEENEQIN